jgi:hypothetical protein
VQLKAAAPHLPIDERTKQLFILDVDRVLALQQANQNAPLSD